MFENDCDRSKFFVSRVNGAPYTTSLLCALSFAMSFMRVSAGIVEYPKAGGNLADNGPDGWNGQKPGLSDKVKIVQSGIYTSTDDVEFYSMEVAATDVEFNLSGNGAQVSLTAESDSVFSAPNTERTSIGFNGGTWFMENGGPFTIGSVAPGFSMAFSGGCVLTNANKFTFDKACSDATVTVADSSRLYVEDFRVHERGGTNANVRVETGGLIHASRVVYLELNGTEGSYGGHTLDVSGENSSVISDGDLNLGIRTTGNRLKVRDGATVHVANVLKLGGNVTSSTNHAMEVRSGSSVNVGELKFSTCNNSVLVSNASFSVDSDLNVGTSTTNNKFVVSGAASAFSYGGSFLDKSNYGAFMLENNAAWRSEGGNLTFLSSSTGTVFGISGGATFDNTDGDADNDVQFYMGGGASSVGNRLEISDGAEVSVEKFFVRGISNAIVVSNATLKAFAKAYGIWLGHAPNGSSTSNCTLVVRGNSPKAELRELKFGSHSVLRYEIPREGYASGFVPVAAEKLSTADSARIEIDCDDWRANRDSNDRIVLFRRIGNDLTSTNKTWLESRIFAVLPPSVRLVIDGTDVVIVKRRGTAIVVR